MRNVRGLRPRRSTRILGPMLAAVRSAAVLGVDALDVIVEVDVAHGLPQWTLVGLAASAVKESRERVSAALANAGYPLPPRRITVSLAPGDLPKSGTAFDLPIAAALLVATGIVPTGLLEHAVVLGELGLDGAVRPVRGVLPVARRLARRDPTAEAARLIVPAGNAAEAQLVPGVRVVTPASLHEFVGWLRAGELPEAAAATPPGSRSTHDVADLADVVGQPGARRALEVSAAGAHALLLIGPPGAGKTMLARCLPGILPPLDPDEALDVTAIHSVAGLLGSNGSTATAIARPFRAPHHSISVAGLVGGGSSPRPGEVSLAHHGVLFLDELLEFPRQVLEALRQPLEDGVVTVTRAAATVAYPARFALIGATNPCPCGRAGEESPPMVRETLEATAATSQPLPLAGGCRCTDAEITRYRGRLSGPLADRIDMHVHVGRVPLDRLGDTTPGEASAAVRARVQRAREIQRRRYAGMQHVRANAQAPGRWLDLRGGLTTEGRRLLRQAGDQLALSARGFHRVLRVARTIADLDPGVGADSPILVTHLAEALRYRPAVPGR